MTGAVMVWRSRLCPGLAAACSIVLPGRAASGWMSHHLQSSQAFLLKTLIIAHPAVKICILSGRSILLKKLC